MLVRGGSGEGEIGSCRLRDLTATVKQPFAREAMSKVE